VRTFTYDSANRLTSVTSGTLTTAFEYDGLGNRTAQTVDGVTTEYVLDVAGGLPEVIVATTGGASTRYVQVQGQVLAQQDSGAWAYVLPDHLGSVRQLVGSDNQVSLAQSYEPFGGLFESAGSGASEFGYTGEWWDAEAGVLYLRARYYEPVVGRFVSKDLWQGDSSRPQSLNAWNYVQGNPLNFTDPSGRIFCPYGVDPETGTCNPPRWEGLVEGLPPTFAQTAVGNPASATVQVALSVLAYIYFRLADNLQPSPPPLRVGSPWEGLREWLPLGQQPSSLIPGPTLGSTPEWLPAVLPGPYVDTPGTTTWVLDFRLVQPCLPDYVLTASSYTTLEDAQREISRWAVPDNLARSDSWHLEAVRLERGGVQLSRTERGHIREVLSVQQGLRKVLDRIDSALESPSWNDEAREYLLEQQRTIQERVELINDALYGPKD
jgi:RHS repeat-associated protein